MSSIIDTLIILQYRALAPQRRKSISQRTHNVETT